jgi:hypothetical protein
MDGLGGCSALGVHRSLTTLAFVLNAFGNSKIGVERNLAATINALLNAPSGMQTEATKDITETDLLWLKGKGGQFERAGKIIRALSH